MTEWRRLELSPYRHYEVSEDGRVRRNGRELKGYIDRYGYRTVLLYYAGLSRRFKVHRLVCQMFNGPCPSGYECAHLDSNKQNNSAANLRWVSRSENQQHNIARGAHGGGSPGGNGHPSAKLTAERVTEARERHRLGESGRKLAKYYGVTSAVMSEALRGKTWKSVAEPCAQGPSA